MLRYFRKIATQVLNYKKLVVEGKIEFNNCTNLQNYRWDHSADGSSTVQFLDVIINNCKNIDSNFIAGSTFAVTGPTQNVTVKPLFKISNCGRAFDGDFRPGADASRDVVAQRRAIQFGAEARLFDRKSYGSGWPAITDLILPPVLLQKIEFYPRPTSAFGGSATATITVKNAIGSTLATITWNMAAPVDIVVATDVRQKITETDNFIRFEYSSSYTGTAAVPFLGDMFLTY